MSAIPEIRHRIKAVSDTRKITRAMYLISSAKMQKAMKLHDKNLPYLERVGADIRYVFDNAGAEIDSKFFSRRPGTRAAYLVIAADKGLCGAYNEEVLRFADRMIRLRNHQQVFVVTVGVAAYAHFSRLHMDPDVHYLHIAQNPTIQSSRSIAQDLRDMFSQEVFDEAHVVFTNMGKNHVLTPTMLPLLPLLADNFRTVAPLHTPTGSIDFIPSASAALDAMVTHYLIGTIYSACVQAYASEQSARMTAMDASTRNADEMLEKLKIELNRARQASITQELNEITAGASSVR